jgi:hypothetical protein
LVGKPVRVWRKDGNEAWILIHIEAQGPVDAEFAKRMYVYRYRLYDRYDRPVVSLAVLGDERKNWRPEHFGYELWGCKKRLEFPIIKRNYSASSPNSGGQPWNTDSCKFPSLKKRG